MTSVVVRAKCLVVKVGSSLVTNQGHGLDHGALAQWAQQIAELKRNGRQVLLVSSGAVAEGMQRLGWAKRPRQLHDLQAAAAVGQMGLVQAYETCFREHGLHAAQILLTHEDLADRRRYLNARSTLRTLLELNASDVVHGAYGIEEGELIISDTLELETLDFHELRASMESIELAAMSHMERIRSLAGMAPAGTEAKVEG